MDKDWKSMNLMCCFTRENHPIGNKLNKGPASDLEALNKLVVIPYFHFEITPNNNPLFTHLAGERETTIEVKKDENLKNIEATQNQEFNNSYWDDWDDDWLWSVYPINRIY
jgi:hypothetical protein